MSAVNIQPSASMQYDIGTATGGARSFFNLSTPAGWWAVWWGLSVLIIMFMFLSL